MKCLPKRVTTAGRYSAVLDHLEPSDLFEPRRASTYVFRVDAGDETGWEIRKTVQDDFCVDNALHRLLSMLVGHEIVAGEDVDPLRLIGSRFECVCVAGSNGGVQLQAVRPLPAKGSDAL